MKEQDRYEGIEFKEVDRKKKVRKKKHYFLRFLAFVCFVVLITMFLRSDFFNIKKIQVKGNSYYNAKQVISLSQAKEGENIIWGKTARKIPDNLLKNPYFEKVKIKRLLPATLVIEVTERKQTAAIAYGEDFIVIDADGIVLRKSNVNPKLTTLEGFTITKLTEGEVIEAEESSKLDSMLKLLKAMTKGDIFFKKINMSKVVVKAYIYDTLIVKGTPKQIIASLDKGELQKVVNDLISQETTHGTISMGDNNYISFSPNF